MVTGHFFSSNQTVSNIVNRKSVSEKLTVTKKWVQAHVQSVTKLFMSTISNKEMKNWSFCNKPTVPSVGGLCITTPNGQDLTKIFDLHFFLRRQKPNFQLLNVDTFFIHLAWPRKLIVSFASPTLKVFDPCTTMSVTRITRIKWAFKTSDKLSKTWTKSWYDWQMKWIDCNTGYPDPKEVNQKIPLKDDNLFLLQK